MPKTLARYVNKSVMGDAYSGDQMLDISNTISIVDDYVYIGNINTGINVKGSPGKSAYQLALAHGFSGTEEEWIASLQGAEGKSAYRVAVDNGFSGTEQEWLASLKGKDGTGGSTIDIIETFIPDQGKLIVRENTQ